MTVQNQSLLKLLHRPSNYFRLSAETQWAIDKSLGLLDVELSIRDLTRDEFNAFMAYFSFTKKDKESLTAEYEKHAGKLG